jgi:hypothetical protein
MRRYSLGIFASLASSLLFLGECPRCLLAALAGLGRCRGFQQSFGRGAPQRHPVFAERLHDDSGNRHFPLPAFLAQRFQKFARHPHDEGDRCSGGGSAHFNAILALAWSVNRYIQSTLATGNDAGGPVNGNHHMKPVLLIDRLYRATFQRGPVLGWPDNTGMRRALEGAYRFSVDDAMSAFMADLANEAFLKTGSGSVNVRIADSLRVQARVPHEAIWIEYNLHAYQIRANAIRDREPLNIDDVPEREGWLVQQHPAIDTAVMMHLFTASNRVHEDGNDTWTFPFAFGWCCDDSPLPWQTLMKNPDGDERWLSELLVGIGGYKRDNINCVRSPLIADPTRRNAAAYAVLLAEWTGVVRRVFALLATIDNLPITRGVARPAKGPHQAVPAAQHHYPQHSRQDGHPCVGPQGGRRCPPDAPSRARALARGFPASACEGLPPHLAGHRRCGRSHLM